MHPHFLEVALHGGYDGGAAAPHGRDAQDAVRQRRELDEAAERPRWLCWLAAAAGTLGSRTAEASAVPSRSKVTS